MAGFFAWFTKLTDRGLDVDELARRLKIDVSQLTSTSLEYRSFHIPKRSGGGRTIDAPNDALKHVQRLILKRILNGLKVHECALGFERDRSIVSHAKRHCGKAVVIRLDVKDFFHNTRSDRVYAYFRFIGWNRNASKLLTALTTFKGQLPQGAPTSPRLSNLINYRMDVRLRAMVRSVSGEGGTYSRYADDITFSVTQDHADKVRAIIKGASTVVRDEGYFLHRKKKMHILPSKYRQTVTGLVVNETVNLPRAKRRWLRAVEHHMQSGKPASITAAQLAGWRGLVNMIHTQRNA